MHAVYAILLPPEGDPEDILVEAEEIVQQVADANNWYTFVGLVLPDGKIVDPASCSFPVSDRWDVHDLAKEVGDDWLAYVRSLEYQEVADVLGLFPDGAETVRRIVERGGREAIVERLVSVVADPKERGYRRRWAAQRLVLVLNDEWPFPERLDSWYRQRVFKHHDVAPEEAAIVLVDIHT